MIWGLGIRIQILRNNPPNLGLHLMVRSVSRLRISDVNDMLLLIFFTDKCVDLSNLKVRTSNFQLVKQINPVSSNRNYLGLK